MPFALPRHSPLLPALRNPEAVLAQLDDRRRALAGSGDLTQAARMARRAGRVVRWRTQAETCATPKPADPVETLIAGLNLARVE